MRFFSGDRSSSELVGSGLHGARGCELAGRRAQRGGQTCDVVQGETFMEAGAEVHRIHSDVEQNSRYGLAVAVTETL